MRGINAIGIFIVVVKIIVIGYYAELTYRARWQSFFNNMDGLGYNYRSDSIAAELTMEAVSIQFIFILFLVGAMIGNLVKVKTISTKVMAIIGLSFSLLIILFSFLVLSSPSAITFDESGAFYLIYALICLAFFIVFLVQSIRFHRQFDKKQNDHILDEEIV